MENTIILFSHNGNLIEQTGIQELRLKKTLGNQYGVHLLEYIECIAPKVCNRVCISLVILLPHSCLTSVGRLVKIRTQNVAERDQASVSGNTQTQQIGCSQQFLVEQSWHWYVTMVAMMNTLTVGYIANHYH